MSVLLLPATPSTGSAGTLAPSLEEILDRADTGTPVSVIVHLVDQAPIRDLDLSLHRAGATRRERHREVVLALQSAATGQAALRADLERGLLEGSVHGFTSYWISNLVIVLAEADEIRRIAARPDVDWVEPNFAAERIEPVSHDRPLAPSDPGAGRGIGVPPGVRAVRAPEVWYGLGYTGAGRLVANLDTGVDGHHPALESRWRGYGGQHPWQECWLDVLDTGTEFPTDLQRHGTHVMGTITGLGVETEDSVGVAPGAQWIACNATGEPAGPAFDNDVLTAYQWFMDPDGDPGTVDDVPDVVQNSWRVHGGGGYLDCDPRWWDAIDNCEAAGVVTTWSAGNEGPSPATIGSPADRASTLTNAFSVGAVDASHYGWPYPIADWSSRGPTECPVPSDRRYKPEVVAPGVDVYSSVPGGGYEGGWNGTSMAGPHVAGVVALVRQANPDLDVASVKTILMETARDEGSPGEDNTYGRGFIDAYEAVQLATSGFGHFEGFVTNESWNDAPLPGVRVALAGTEHLFRTDGNGHYAGSVAPGIYTAVASLDGFLPDSADIVIDPGSPVNQDFSLIDAAGPVITGVTDIVHAPEAEGYPVSARVMDYSTVASVRLFYRVGGQEWSFVDMAPISLRGEAHGRGPVEMFHAARGVVPRSLPAENSGWTEYAAEIPAIPAGNEVDYYVEAEDGAGFTSRDPEGAPEGHYTFLVTDLIYDYAAEDPGDENWTLGVPGDDATGGLWVRDDPVGTYEGDLPFQPEDDHTPDPGVKCFVTGNGTPGGYIGENDVDEGCTTLLSPIFDLSGAETAYVNYHRWYVQSEGNSDIFQIKVSPDGGSTWVSLEFISGSVRSWIRSSLRISDFVPLTSEMQFRFRACDQLFQSFVEAAIDDFSVESFTPGAADAPGPSEPSGPSGPTTLARSRPNPSHPPTSIRFRLSNPGPARLEIFDVSGRRVRTLVDGPLVAGSHAIPWDGKDDQGVPVANGVYFYRLESGAFSQSRRMLLFR